MKDGKVRAGQAITGLPKLKQFVLLSCLYVVKCLLCHPSQSVS
jgi:hypothetical protein